MMACTESYLGVVREGEDCPDGLRRGGLNAFAFDVVLTNDLVGRFGRPRLARTESKKS